MPNVLRGGGGGGGEGGTHRQTDRQADRDSLFTRVIDKHVCFFFFYIQPSPEQGTTLDLIMYTFSKLRHTGTHME